MMKQVFAVSWLSLKTIPQRLGSSAVAVVGIAGVVIVFVAVLSMAQGFYAAIQSVFFMSFLRTMGPASIEV